MDNQNLPMDHNQNPNQEQNLAHQLQQFQTYVESAQHQFNAWQVAMKQQMQDIQDALKEFRDLTANEMGISRLRQTMRDVLVEGEQHVKALQATGEAQLEELQKSNDQIRKLAKKSFERLDRASNFVVKNISDSLSSFRLNDFKRLTDESREVIEHVSVSTIKRMKEMVHWFHWKNLALAAAITIIVTLSLGLFLNDETPWEAHNKAVVQRNAGQALINAWPSLSPKEQQRIMEHAKKAII